MIELAKHIEVLLLENDCVIVPGLGGFIAHNRPATWRMESDEFFPPVRSIGFNPQLIMNDGLLVQSYMQAYNTDFPDATRKIEKTVESLKEELYQRGQIALQGIGTLYYNMKGGYGFEPEGKVFFTPSLYGLEPFSLPLLKKEEVAVPDHRPAAVPQIQAVPVHQKSRIRRFIPAHHWLQNAVAVAAAVILFFILSVPVENTYVDEADYASLGSAGLFEAIRNQSLVSNAGTAQKAVQQSQKKIRNNVNTLKPVKVKTEKVSAPQAQPAKQPRPGTQAAAQPKAEKTSGKGYYIIAASLTTAADANKQAEIFRKQGYKDVQVLESAGRYRVALARYSSQAEAYRQTEALKKDKAFSQAWVFSAN